MIPESLRSNRGYSSPLLRLAHAASAQRQAAGRFRIGTGHLLAHLRQRIALQKLQQFKLDHAPSLPA